MSEAINFDKLETPPLVAEMLARLDPPAADLRCWAKDYKLSYYFGGQVVATEPTDAGLMVVAAVPVAELRDALDALDLPRDQFERLQFVFPAPIDDHLATLAVREAAAVAGGAAGG